MSKTIRVTAPYVTLKVKDIAGGDVVVGYYAGAVVENVDDASAQHHIDNDMAVDASSGDLPAAPPFPPFDTDSAVAPLDAETLGTLGTAEPTGNASREEWENYARTKGAGDEDLVDGDGKQLSRNELREKYQSEQG